MQQLDPWGSMKIENYDKLFSEFGIESFEKFSRMLDKREISNRYIRRKIIFGHRDFGRIMSAIENSTEFVMMTGLMPSGRFHFGHKMLADQIVWYQGVGAEVYLCVADLEAYLTRNKTPDECKRTAIEEYLKNYVALGLTDKNLHFWFQSDYRLPYYQMRDRLANRVTFNELSAIYGELSPGKILSVLTQVADILHPQLDEFSGKVPVVVPVGADQDPHIRLTRDIASKISLIPPSSTYHKFMEGLQGGKMSSSDERSYIALTDTPDDAERKIKSAVTGGRDTAKKQKELGGVPEKCMVYELFVYHLIESDEELSEIYRKCKSGEMSCGKCKSLCASLIGEFLEKHNEKRENNSDMVEKILSENSYEW